MGSRLKRDSGRLFELFARIEHLADTEPVISLLYPATANDQELIDCLPKFAYPVSKNFNSYAVDQFSFVLTDISSKFRFGFCHLAAESKSCLCIVSYLPWFDLFFRLLNYISNIISCCTDNTELHHIELLLDQLISADVSKPSTHVDVTLPTSGLAFKFTCPASDVLPSIPEDRNLTEYYSAVDVNNMIYIFASLLCERRILITSRRLCRLTACIHAAAALIYPLHWQQIFIPALPSHLIDYCAAPLPYLIGVHSSLLTDAVLAELEGIVHLDADDNRITSSYDDVSSLPRTLMKYLTKQLKTRELSVLGDTVSRTFFNALVLLIGDYHTALSRQADGRVMFDSDQFVSSRPAKFQPMISTLLHSQSFCQFIDERVDILNSTGTPPSDMFEDAVNWCRQVGTGVRTSSKKDRPLHKDIRTKTLSKFASKVSMKNLKKFGKVFGLSETKTATMPSPSRRQNSHTHGAADSAVDLKRATSPPRVAQCQRMLSAAESDVLLEAVLTQRTSILTDPDMQRVLRKSYSLDDLQTSDVSDINGRSQSGSETSVTDAIDGPELQDQLEPGSRKDVSVEGRTVEDDDAAGSGTDQSENHEKTTSTKLPSHVKLLVTHLESRYSTIEHSVAVPPPPPLHSCSKISALQDTLISMVKDPKTSKASLPELENCPKVNAVRDVLISKVQVPESSKMAPPSLQSCPKITALRESLISKVQGDPATAQTTRTLERDLVNCPSVSLRQTVLLGTAKQLPRQKLPITATASLPLNSAPTNCRDALKDELTNGMERPKIEGPRVGLSNSRDVSRGRLLRRDVLCSRPEGGLSVRGDLTGYELSNNQDVRGNSFRTSDSLLGGLVNSATAKNLPDDRLLASEFTEDLTSSALLTTDDS